MITIVQRVSEARVVVAGETLGATREGLVALTAIVKGDGPREIEWMAGKLATLRIFRSEDGQKHFDRDVKQIGGSILLVSNFTVSALTKQGRRPSLDRAADPATADTLFNQLLDALRAQKIPVQTGKFGGDMKVILTNDGPATFILDSSA